MTISTKATLPIVLCFTAILGFGQTPPSGTPADNTKVNKRDQHPAAVTADQQKVNASDQELTRNIRRSILADKTLSTYAHNIKIISQNGTVTLKGPVKTEAEKKTIVAKAVEVTKSADKVSDQISITR